MKNINLIELGFCRKPHGVKGAFAFSLHNPKESILKKGLKVFLKPLSKDSSLPSEGQEATIKSISFGNKVICFLEEVTDRNSVEAWLPFSILLERSEFPEVNEGEVYLNDLIGCEVLNEGGKHLGKVSALGSNGVQDIIQVSGGESDFDVLLIDSFVLEIDTENNKIVIVEPEYL